MRGAPEIPILKVALATQNRAKPAAFALTPLARPPICPASFGTPERGVLTASRPGLKSFGRFVHHGRERGTLHEIPSPA